MKTSKGKKSIQIAGRVVTELEQKRSKDGKQYVRFCVIDDKTRKTYAVLGFKSLANITQEQIPVDSKVSLLGEISPSDDGTVFASTISGIDESVRETRIDYIRKHYGSEAEYNRKMAILEADYERAGFVKVRDEIGTRWLAKDDCIMADGRWQSKIEYIMQKLGPERVTKELKKFIKTDKLIKGLSRFEIDRYRTLLETLLDEILLGVGV